MHDQIEQLGKIGVLENEVAQKEDIITQMQDDVIKYQEENAVIRQQTEQLIEQVKKEQEDKEYLVDRRMINQFLITYLNKSGDKQTQQNMLQALSKILQFTDKEKEMLGISQSQLNATRGFS